MRRVTKLLRTVFAPWREIRQQRMYIRFAERRIDEYVKSYGGHLRGAVRIIDTLRREAIEHKAATAAQRDRIVNLCQALRIDVAQVDDLILSAAGGDPR